MDDLNEKLTRLLSSPEGMSKIQSAMAALGGAMTETESTSTPTPTPPPDTNLGAQAATLTKLLPLLGKINQDNEDTRLLQALRPYLHGPRAERLDESVRLMRLLQLLPLLQEQGGGRDGG